MAGRRALAINPIMVFFFDAPDFPRIRLLRDLGPDSTEAKVSAVLTMACGLLDSCWNPRFQEFH